MTIVEFDCQTVVFKDADKARNNDITHFLGNGKILLAYKLGSNVFSLMTRNNVQSNFKRGAEELTWSFPLHRHLRGYIQAFSGYGQSLIEYNHYSNAFALGITLNDWL